jgi:hypothetical protein
MRTVWRFSLNGTFVVLSTFMTAFPAELTNASRSDAACDAVTKLFNTRQRHAGDQR